MSKGKTNEPASPRQVAWRQRSAIFFVATGARNAIRNIAAGCRDTNYLTEAEWKNIHEAVAALDRLVPTRTSSWEESVRDKYPTWKELEKLPPTELTQNPLTEDDAVPPASPGLVLKDGTELTEDEAQRIARAFPEVAVPGDSQVISIGDPPQTEESEI